MIKISAENAAVRAGSELPLKEGKYVRITVEDKGIGIPREYLSKVFDPYFTTKQKGSGLGLATVYSIIRNHDGYIGVQSEPGAGTRFYIYLPASGEKVKAKRKINRLRREGRMNGKGRVLIMDDEALVRLSTGRALNDMGYEVEYARDGNEAIETYRRAKDGNKPFDVVVMDLTIPGGMGGKEAIERS